MLAKKEIPTRCSTWKIDGRTSKGEDADFTPLEAPALPLPPGKLLPPVAPFALALFFWEVSPVSLCGGRIPPGPPGAPGCCDRFPSASSGPGGNRSGPFGLIMDGSWFSGGGGDWPSDRRRPSSGGRFLGGGGGLVAVESSVSVENNGHRQV